MDSLLRTDPSSKITFTISPGWKTTTQLKLTNISNAPVAYKVKTTNVRRYCVCPNTAILEAGTSLDVELSQASEPGPPEDLEACSDRFLLQAVKLGDALPALVGEKDLTEVWNKAPAEYIAKIRFSVKLELKEVPKGDVPSAVTGATPTFPTPATKPAIAGPLRASESATTSARPPLAPPTPQNSTNTSFGRSPSTPTPPLPAIPSAASRSTAPLPLAPVKAAISQPSAASSLTAQTFPTASPSAPSTAASPAQAIKTVTATSGGTEDEETGPDYNSVAWARERALGVRPAPKISPPVLDRSTRQRVAVERAGELVRVINTRQHDIDIIRKELAEARHKLEDARMATGPAYDVRYEVNDSARVPFAQICIMAVISGALLQLLV